MWGIKMKRKRKRRSSYLNVRDATLGKGRAVTIWGHGLSGEFVCRLEVSSAGVDVYSGAKGQKLVCKLT